MSLPPTFRNGRSAEVKKPGPHDEACTPKNIREAVWRFAFEIAPSIAAERGRIALDPCTNDRNPMQARIAYTPADDGLKAPWAWQAPMAWDVTYMNPVYSNVAPWLQRIAELKAHGPRLALIPGNRTDQLAYQLHVLPRVAAMCWIDGRVRYETPEGVPHKHTSTFPSVIPLWVEPSNHSAAIIAQFVVTFSDLGTVRVFRPAGHR